jgi:hypothetical protein
VFAIIYTVKNSLQANFKNIFVLLLAFDNRHAILSTCQRKAKEKE